MTMPDVSHSSHRRAFGLVFGAAGVLIAATLLLWAHYGTAVFFEMIQAGFAACFG
jgi:hypothetical protein